MTILDEIIAKRKERLLASKKERPENSLQRIVPAPIPFFQNEKQVTLIAECKKGSPSKGIFLTEYDPVALAVEYERGGATAISCLTEPDYFFGSEQDLKDIKQAVKLPVLRKDFIFDPYQIKESWAMGADAILLIAAVLSEKQLMNLSKLAAHYNLDVLLEVHNLEEMDKALNIPVKGIGINARNLKDFTIDMEVTKELCKKIPKDRIAIAESGMKSPQAGAQMYKAGFRGFLVGEYFVTSKDISECVKDFKKKLR